MEENNNRVIIPTYNRVWKLDRYIYSIGNQPLLRPINLKALSYFIFVWMGVAVLTATPPFRQIGELLSSSIGFIHSMRNIIRFILLPVGITVFITKIKIDGREPHIFLFRYCSYYLHKNEHIERFKIKQTYVDKTIHITGYTTHGNKL